MISLPIRRGVEAASRPGRRRRPPARSWRAPCPPIRAAFTVQPSAKWASSEVTTNGPMKETTPIRRSPRRCVRGSRQGRSHPGQEGQDYRGEGGDERRAIPGSGRAQKRCRRPPPGQARSAPPETPASTEIMLARTTTAASIAASWTGSIQTSTRVSWTGGRGHQRRSRGYGASLIAQAARIAEVQRPQGTSGSNAKPCIKRKVRRNNRCLRRRSRARHRPGAQSALDRPSGNSRERSGSSIAVRTRRSRELHP